MSILPQLERDLTEAADRLHARGTAGGLGAARRAPRRARRMRLGALVLTGLLCMSTAALAASGVIRIGSPVPADRSLHRDSGLGVPLRSGATRLLPLRVADPEGGPPWGMRIVRTSRKEVCMQIGRVHDGKLGELGIDGAFHNDGAFHPRPAGALPDEQDGGTASFSNENTYCDLAGEAASVSALGLPSSAVDPRVRGPRSMAALEAMPRRELRDIHFGLLGPQAVSITYAIDGRQHTQPVAPGSGAYLIVLPLRKGQSLREFGGASGAPYGQLSPGGTELLSKITYRIDGRLCERGLHLVRTSAGAWRSAGPARDLAHPCPQEEGGSTGPGRHARPANLHEPVHTRLLVKGGVVRALRVSFKAPYAVDSAREQYALFLPEKSCHLKKGEIEVEGGAAIAIDHNVKRGASVSYTIPYPFRVRRLCSPGKLIVKPEYDRNAMPLQRTIIGEAIVKQPPGTRAR